MRHWLFAAMLAALAAGCGDDGAWQRVDFGVRVAGAQRSAPGPLQVQTPLGWSVTVERAQVTLSALYLRNAPANAGTSQIEGRAVAEFRGEVTVDALDPAPVSVTVDARGTTEPARSAEVRFTEATTGPVADAEGPGIAVARVAGTAVRGTETVRFDGTLRIPAQSPNQTDYEWFNARRVTNVPASVSLRAGASLTVRVDASRWFDGVAFDALPSGTSGTRTFDSASARTQLRNGLGRAQDVFTFHTDP